jgi:hypothetical protein
LPGSRASLKTYRVSPLARAVRRWVRLAIAWSTLAVVAAPAAFGPSIGVMMRELGASAAEHVCKCGMPVGKCGCPECDRLEQERLQEHAVERLAALKRHCDDDAPAIPFGMLPNGVPAAIDGATLPVPRGERLRIARAVAHVSSPGHEPPTPPPRSASV